ncbi:MAG: DUF2156 domain-containing protein [Clostridia bacterium]|nr:DUF2156 domain-containing protein [Clostridia bacterium]
MKLETITLHHHDPVEQIRSRYSHHSSSHSFVSLFLWQREMELQLYLTSDMFAVKCGRRGENCWFFPCGKEEAVVGFLRQQMAAGTEPLMLCYMRREDVELLEREFPRCFTVKAAPEDDEYLYDREAQILLQGKDFRHHRNSLNRLQQKYEPETYEITVGNLDAAAVVLEHVRESRTETDGYCSVSAEQMILEYWDKLGMNGVIVYINGNPAAITAGYRISEQIYDICLCHQVLKDPNIAVYARHQLFMRLPQTVRLINAEEDLGLEGLRCLKQGMRPIGLIEMFEGVSR